MIHSKILVISGKSGSGKTYQLKKIANDQKGCFFHADEVLDILFKSITGISERLEEQSVPAQFLPSNTTTVIFDDVDYVFRGKTHCQEELCKVICNMARQNIKVVMGITDIEDVPVIKQFLTSEQIKELVELKMI